MFQALARLLLVQALLRKPPNAAWSAPFFDVEIDPRGCYVAVAARNDTLDEGNHVRDVIRRAAEHRRRGQPYIQFAAVALELRDIKIRHFARRLTLGAR